MARARGAAALLLALTGACGGGPGGGADAGGAAGASGAAGAGGDAGSSFCTDFTPCGGNVVGTWNVDPRCSGPSIGMAPGSSCAGETWDASGVSLNATASYAADGTATFSYSASGQVTLTTPTSCLVANGMPLACTDASAGKMYKTVAFTGGKLDATSCAPTAAGLCGCTFHFAPAPIAATGSYTVTGTQLKTFLGNEVDDFCVTGTTLKLRNSDPLASPTPKVQVYARP